MRHSETLTQIVRHLDDARADAAEFQAAGCYGLARCRRRDAQYLEGLLARFTTDARQAVETSEAR